jgi:hypothetical protein
MRFGSIAANVAGGCPATGEGVQRVETNQERARS